MPMIEIHSPNELDIYEDKVRDSAHIAVERLQNLNDAGLEFLQHIKFERIGRDPTEDTDLNLIEQVNQSFTYMVSFKAARYLLESHRDCGGLRLNLGTRSGSDIETLAPGLIAAEVFAATLPTSNRKLAQDINKVASVDAVHRYVFFHSPGYAEGRHPELERSDAVQVWVMGAS